MLVQVQSKVGFGLSSTVEFLIQMAFFGCFALFLCQKIDRVVTIWGHQKFPGVPCAVKSLVAAQVFENLQGMHPQAVVWDVNKEKKPFFQNNSKRNFKT